MDRKQCQHAGEFCEFCAGPVHAAAVSMSSYVCRSCWVRKALSPWSRPSPLALTVFLIPLPLSSLSPEGRDLKKTSI